MISLFPNIHFPRDVASYILVEAAASAEALKIYSQVSKNFKLAADDEGFLHSLLIKLKGSSFSDSRCMLAPKKFLILDQMMMAAYQSQIAKKGSGFEHTILKTTSVLALKDLNMRLVTITNQSSIKYFRISEPQLENLKHAAIVNQNEWQVCIESIVRSMLERNFPHQTNMRISDDAIEFLKKNELLLLPPKIRDFEVSDVFFVNANELIVHSYKGKELTPDMFQDVAVDPEQAQILDVFRNLKNLINEMDLALIHNELRVELEITPSQTLHAELKECSANWPG